MFTVKTVAGCQLQAGCAITRQQNRIMAIPTKVKNAILSWKSSTCNIQQKMIQSSSLQTKRSRLSATTVCVSNTVANPKVAILFDCDGVIVETEELHRQAYNASFKESVLTVDHKPVEWSVEYYDILANTVGGGKPKMRWHFTNTCGGQWPTYVMHGVSHPPPQTDEEKTALIDYLQDQKTVFYKDIVERAAKARPGVLEMMDEGLANPDIAMGICSAATRGGFEKVVNAIVGPERLAKFDVIIAGDDVDRKKPDPQIYNVASERLGMPPTKCVVIEDSLVGLRAAKGAGMNCIITYTNSTHDVDFSSEGADVVLPNLGGQCPKSESEWASFCDVFGVDYTASASNFVSFF